MTNNLPSFCFINGSYFCIVKQHDNELLEHFVERGIFMSGHVTENENAYKMLEMKSHIYLYNKMTSNAIGDLIL